MKKFKDMTDEEFSFELGKIIDRSENFTNKCNELRHLMNINVLEFCLSVAVAADSCEESFPEEWAAVQKFMEEIRGERNGTK